MMDWKDLKKQIISDMQLLGICEPYEIAVKRSESLIDALKNVTYTHRQDVGRAIEDAEDEKQEIIDDIMMEMNEQAYKVGETILESLPSAELDVNNYMDCEKIKAAMQLASELSLDQLEAMSTKNPPANANPRQRKLVPYHEY